MAQESNIEAPVQEPEASRRIARSEWVILAIVIAAYLIQVLIILKKGAPLGHDEAVYALRSRDLVHGTNPLGYWNPFRAPGLPVFLSPLQFLRSTEPYVRGVVAAFGALLVVSTWWAGRSMFDRPTGLIAAAGIAVSPVILNSSTQVWPDVPGAALGMVILAFYAWTLSTGTISRYTVVAVPVVTGIATLTRFGAPMPIAIGLIVLTLWQYRVALGQWRLLALTAALTTAVVVSILAIPNVTAWAQVTGHGSAVSPLSAINGLTGSKDLPWTRGFTDYWTLRSSLAGGIVSGLILATGLLSGLLRAAGSRRSRDALIASVGIALLTTGVIALTVHGEARYLAPVYPWLWIAAASGLAFLITAWNRTTKLAVGALILSIGAATAFSSSYVSTTFNIAAYQLIETAGNRIDKTSEDFTCSVLTSYAPQIGWYSKCGVFLFDQDTARATRPGLPDGKRYMVLLLNGKRQPEGAILDDYLRQTSALIFTVGAPELGSRQYLEVYDLGPVPGGSG